jgi:hypothetical protein
MMNPFMRLLLRSPLGVAIRPFALIEFRGRLSGRRFRVPVGFYKVNADEYVFTPAPWSVNFGSDTPVTVHFHGRRREMLATRITSPASVAATLQALVDGGGSLKLVGLAVDAGHRITAEDMVIQHRDALHLRPI